MKRLISTINNLVKKEEIAIIIIILLSLFPLYIPGFLYTHDGIIHLYRTAGAFENLKNFDIFNKIYFNMISGFGYGWGIFYPPLSAIIPAFFMLFGISLFTAEKLFILLASVLAGIFGYKLFKELFNNKFCAMLVTFIYVLSPYKINQIIIRGAMGEILLFTFLPLVILGLIKILKKEYKYSYYFVLGTVGIVYSHMISTVYTAIFAFIFLLLNYKLVFNKKTIIELIKSTIIIVILSLPILVPIAEHQMANIYKVNSMTSGDVADSVVHFGQLIGSSIENNTVQNTGYYSNDKEMNYMLGLTSIIILSLLPFAYKKIKENKELSKFIVFFILLAISIFMMTVQCVWNKLDVLDVIQYPWRILTFSVLFISILAGYILKSILNEKNKYSIYLFVAGFSFIFVFLIGIHANFAKTLNQEFNFSNQQLSAKDDFGSIAFALGYSHEYLPNNTSVDILKTRSKSMVSLDKTIGVSEENIEHNNYSAKFNVKEADTTIELPYIYYQGYSVKVDNKNVKYNMSESGFIQTNITEIGNHSIEVKYTGTKKYIFLNILAIITIIAYIIFTVRNLKMSNGKLNKGLSED